MPTSSSNTGGGAGNDGLEDQTLDQLIAKAVDAAAKGENVEQLLEVMLISLAAGSREKARKMFSAALAKRGLRQPSGEADIPTRSVLNRMRVALAVSARQMMERVMQLVRSRPDIATRIQQAGKVLVQHGVRDDKAPLSEADLGTMAPSATVGRSQQERGGRNT